MELYFGLGAMISLRVMIGLRARIDLGARVGLGASINLRAGTSLEQPWTALELGSALDSLTARIGIGQPWS